MILSAKVIKQRTNHNCEACAGEITGYALRVSGCADKGDRLRTIYSHLACSKPWTDRKIQAALAAHFGQEPTT